LSCSEQENLKSELSNIDNLKLSSADTILRLQKQLNNGKEIYLSDSGIENEISHKRITKYKGYLFNFLNYPDVPPDNNGSERAIRNVKAMR
jgi:hypothetical protein